MKLKTFIKWSGNKSKHLRHLIPHVPKDFNKYIEPFFGNTQKVSYYNDNISRLNSYEYNNNNLYSYSKSYANVNDSYKHYIDTILDIKKNLLNQEKQLIQDTTEELNKLRKITQKDSS